MSKPKTAFLSGFLFGVVVGALIMATVGITCSRSDLKLTPRTAARLEGAP
jgi:hypothetical protein